MAILYANHLGGTTTDNPLTLAATTLNSAGLADLPTVASPNIVRIVLDPEAVDGAPEIAYVTAHTSAATAATVARGQEGSSAREHAAGTAWVVAATAADFSGGLLGKSGLAKGDLLVATGSTATARQAVGSNNQVLVADSGQTNGVKWATVGAASLASNAVTTAKILDENVTAGKLAADAVTTAKIADGNVTTAKLDDGAVSDAKLDPSGVLAQHGCVLSDAAQSFPTTAFTTVTWGTELIDTHGYHSAGSGTITFPEDGFYVVTARLTRETGQWGASSFGRFVMASGSIDFLPNPAGSIMAGTMVQYFEEGATLTVGATNAGATVGVVSSLTIAKVPFLS